jgi:hypothetical protein
VVTLRDAEGLFSAEVCAVLDIAEGNQRVLLPSARTRDPRRLAGKVRVDDLDLLAREVLMDLYRRRRSDRDLS